MPDPAPFVNDAPGSDSGIKKIGAKRLQELTIFTFVLQAIVVIFSIIAVCGSYYTSERGVKYQIWNIEDEFWEYDNSTSSLKMAKFSISAALFISLLNMGCAAACCLLGGKIDKAKEGILRLKLLWIVSISNDVWGVFNLLAWLCIDIYLSGEGSGAGHAFSVMNAFIGITVGTWGELFYRKRQFFDDNLNMSVRYTTGSTVTREGGSGIPTTEIL